MGVFDRLIRWREDKCIRYGPKDPLWLCNLPPVPDDISFDVPYDSSFLERDEGYISLGHVPNIEGIEAKKLKNVQALTIKSTGSLTFEVPQAHEALLPMIKTAAAFEMASGPNTFKSKYAVLTVRDIEYLFSTDSQKIHRDPPRPINHGIQHVYSFASNNPTRFPKFKNPDPYELVCFTSASPHGRPQVIVRDDEVLRRVFVGVTFVRPPLMKDVIAGALNFSS